MITDETRKKWDEKINAIYTCAMNSDINLNEWEEFFIDSIQIKREKGEDLSHNQSKCLNRIYDRIK